MISFKKAVLQLQVTPQITPDSRTILDLDVRDDEVGQVVVESGESTCRRSSALAGCGGLWLPILAADVSSPSAAPPGTFSPYGIDTTCAGTN